MHAVKRSQAFQKCQTILSRRHLSTSCFPSDTRVLVLSTLYPEPQASAAGVRTLRLLRELVECPEIASIHYATSTTKQAPSHETTGTHELLQDIDFHVLAPNRSQDIRDFLVKTLPSSSNWLVLFDRFYTEEMYSFHIREHLGENAVLALDMQDVHSLRAARHRASKQFSNSICNVQAVTPAIDDSMWLRELSSIHRCDLTLVCSPTEMKLLADQHILQGKLCWAPLLSCNSVSPPKEIPSFKDTRDFVFCGGFRHAPNVDAVHQLKRLWPRIRQQLANNVNLHIYGAHCPDHLRQRLHDPASGFWVHGFAPTLHDVFHGRRILLAPLRFGAGLKGKIVDAWENGVPVVTTSVGSEGLVDDDTLWPGRITDTDDSFVQAAVDLYQDEVSWNTYQILFPALLKCLAEPDSLVMPRLASAVEGRKEQRIHDPVRALVWHQANRSVEYFSKFIEYKEKWKDATADMTD